MPASGIKCAYCGATRKKYPNRKFFRFPRDPVVCKMWLDACDKPYLNKKTPHQLYFSQKLCSVHFEEEAFRTEKKHFLHSMAYPTKFVREHPLNDKIDPMALKKALQSKLKKQSVDPKEDVNASSYLELVYDEENPHNLLKKVKT